MYAALVEASRREATEDVREAEDCSERMEGVGVKRLKAGLEREAGRGVRAREVRGESRMRESEVNLEALDGSFALVETTGLIRRVRWIERPKRCSESRKEGSASRFSK